MIRSSFFLAFTGVGLVLIGALLAYGYSYDPKLKDKQQLVRAIGLTDLALFSEARYTRHPSQADLFSAFQDFPGALEHFPSGSLIAPAPLGLTKWIGVEKPQQRQLQ